jgi:hypothetical protein
VRNAAAEEDPDDGLGTRSEVGAAVGRSVGRERIGFGDTVFEEHRGEGQAGEAHAGVEQE